MVVLALVLASPIGTSRPCGDWGSWITFIISHSGEFALCSPPQLAHFGGLWMHPCRLVQLRHEWVVVSWCGVSTYSAYRGVFASAVVVSGLLAEFALIAWAGRELFLHLVLFSEDYYSVS